MKTIARETTATHMNRHGLRAAALCATLALGVQPALAAVTCTNENTAIPESTPTADFTSNADGTTVHATTGLMWMRCSLGQTWNGTTCTGTASTYTWQQALQVAQDINSGSSNADNNSAAGFADYTDWRLPNKKELESILEQRCWYPAINATPFPATPSSLFWSSSTYSAAGALAWYVDFGNGGVSAYGKDFAFSVRLVRAGQ